MEKWYKIRYIQNGNCDIPSKIYTTSILADSEESAKNKFYKVHERNFCSILNIEVE